MLGQLSADVGHILRSLDASNTAQSQLRDEIKGENASLREEMRESQTKLNDRLTKVEKFNTRVAIYAGIALPFFIAMVNYAVPILLAML